MALRGTRRPLHVRVHARSKDLWDRHVVPSSVDAPSLTSTPGARLRHRRRARHGSAEPRRSPYAAACCLGDPRCPRRTPSCTEPSTRSASATSGTRSSEQTAIRSARRRRGRFVRRRDRLMETLVGAGLMPVDSVWPGHPASIVPVAYSSVPKTGENRRTSRPHLALRGTTWHYVAQGAPYMYAYMRVRRTSGIATSCHPAWMRPR